MARIYDRDGVWWLDFTDHQGRRVRASTKLTERSLAQIALGHALADVERGRVGLPPLFPHLAGAPRRVAEGPPTFGQALDQWREARLARVRSEAKRRYAVEAHAALVRHAKVQRWAQLADLTPAAVEQWVQSLRTPGRGASTVNRLRSTLSSLMAFAVTMGWRSSNPVAAVAPLPDEASSRPARAALLPEHLGRLVRETPDPRGALWGFLAFTGLRRSEAEAVRLDWIDEPGGCLRLPASITKAGVDQTIALAGVVLHMIARLIPCAPGDGRLIDQVPTCQQLRADLEALGLPHQGLVVHELRHTLATLAPLAGVPIEDLPKVMRHASIDQSLSAYQHRSHKRLADSLDQIADLCGVKV